MANVARRRAQSGLNSTSTANETVVARTQPAEGAAFLTFRAAAEIIGVPYYQVQRAARMGLLPTYRLFGGRRLLKLCEVVAVIERTREGGNL